jgi:hypothetical protein
MPDSLNFASALPRLRRNGYVVLPRFFGAADCALLRFEAQQALHNHATENPYGRAARLYPKDYDQFPGIRGLLIDDLELQHLGHAYWGGRLQWGQETFVCHEYPKEDHARQGYLHFDRRRTFKCFVYLVDTTHANGALRLVPGSHSQGAAWRQNHSAGGVPYSEILNRPGVDFDAEVPDSLSLEEPAGTLIVFDSDILHRGGRVTTGERWVIRTHSR